MVDDIRNLPVDQYHKALNRLATIARDHGNLATQSGCGGLRVAAEYTKRNPNGTIETGWESKAVYNLAELLDWLGY